MQIIINGDPETVEDGITLAELIAQLGLQPRYVAVERNLELIPRAEHNRCILQPDDRLEIVTLVGGG